MLKFITYSLILFTIFACSNDKLFKRVEDKSYIGNITSFKILASDKKLLSLAKKAAKEANLPLASSSFSIFVESSKYPAHCNNPLTPAYEATYDGYVKITVKKAFKNIYFIQQDFHGDVDGDILENLFEILKEDLKIK